MNKKRQQSKRGRDNGRRDNYRLNNKTILDPNEIKHALKENQLIKENN